MELQETCSLMCSNDYTDRFLAEYYQLKNRTDKLIYMLEELEEGNLDFYPTSPKKILDMQAVAMVDYLQVLEQRAKIEGIKLN